MVFIKQYTFVLNQDTFANMFCIMFYIAAELQKMYPFQIK